MSMCSHTARGRARVYPELRALIGATVPDLRGMFLRGHGSRSHLQWNGDIIGNTWTTHQSAALGVVQGDAIRNIWGFGFTPENNASYSGAATSSGHASFVHGVWSTSQNAGINASRIVPTATENRPVNMAVRYLIRASQ